MNRIKKSFSPVCLFALTIVLLFGVAGSAYAQKYQSATLTAPASVNKAAPFDVTVKYDVSDGVKELNGFGVIVYYDDAAVTYGSYTSLSTAAEAYRLGTAPVDVADTDNKGGFGATGRYVKVTYLKLFQPNGFPNTTLPVDLFKLSFTAKNTDGTTTIKAGQAELASGYTFQGTNATVQIGVSGWTITPTAGANGTITPATAQTVANGGSATFTVAPASGYMVDTFTVDGAAATLTNNQYVFTNVTANHTIAVTFKVIPAGTWTITPVVTGGNGSISPATPQTVADGGSITFTVTPVTDYVVNTVTVDGAAVSLTNNQYVFTNVKANHTIEVTFIKQGVTYTITPTAGANGTISPATVQTVAAGHDMTFTVAPATGYVVDTVTVDGAAATLTNNQYTFTNVSANHTIAVTFKTGCDAKAVFTTSVSNLIVNCATTGSGGALSFNYGDGSAATTSTTHTYAAAGTYTITLTATGTGGCGTDTATKSVTVGGGTCKPGDADLDGEVDIFDALKIAMYVAGLANISDPCVLDALDVDENGKVDINDALAIAKFEVGLDCGCVLNR